MLDESAGVTLTLENLGLPEEDIEQLKEAGVDINAPLASHSLDDLGDILKVDSGPLIGDFMARAPCRG